MAEFKSGSDKGSVLTGQSMAVDPMRNPQGPFKGRGEEAAYFATGVGASLAAVFAAFPPRQAKEELQKASSALDAMPQDEPIGQANELGGKTSEARKWRVEGEGMNRYMGMSGNTRGR